MNARGHAWERARMTRGWLELPEVEGQAPWVSGWCCPVVLSVIMRRQDLVLGFRARVGRPPCRLACVPRHPGSIVPLKGQRLELQVHIHQPTLARYCSLQSFFPLLAGPCHTHVLCQTKMGEPDVLVSGNFALSCGRVVNNQTARSCWCQAKKSNVWVCEVCYVAHCNRLPMDSYPSEVEDSRCAN